MDFSNYHNLDVTFLPCSQDLAVQLNQLLDVMQQSQSLQDLMVLRQRVDETIMSNCQGGKKK